MYCPNCKTVTSSRNEKCEYCKGPLLTTLPQEKLVDKQPEPESNPASVQSHQGINVLDGLSLGTILMFGATLLGVIAFFVPFFGISGFGGVANLSAFELAKSIAKLSEITSDSYGALSNLFGTDIASFFKNPDTNTFERLLTKFLILFVLTGPLFFGFFTLNIFFRLFNSKGYGLGLAYAIPYTIVSAIAVGAISSELGMDFGFFSFVKEGYYLGVVSVFLAGAALFFSNG